MFAEAELGCPKSSLLFEHFRFLQGPPPTEQQTGEPNWAGNGNDSLSRMNWALECADSQPVAAPGGQGLRGEHLPLLSGARLVLGM